MKKDEDMKEGLGSGAPEIINNYEGDRRSSYPHLVKVPGRDLIFFGQDDDFKAPPLGPNEVKLKPYVVLLDSSDAHVRGEKGMHPLAKGKTFIPLHEGAGRITNVGESVTRF